MAAAAALEGNMTPVITRQKIIIFVFLLKARVQAGVRVIPFMRLHREIAAIIRILLASLTSVPKQN